MQPAGQAQDYLVKAACAMLQSVFTLVRTLDATQTAVVNNKTMMREGLLSLQSTWAQGIFRMRTRGGPLSANSWSSYKHKLSGGLYR